MKRVSLIENIIDEIKDLIIIQEMKDGDMLPSQVEMAKTLGVSRPSLREALNRLELLGLIETKHGSGTYVKSINAADFMNPLSSFLVMDQKSALELLDARFHVEGAVASLAAEHAGQDDLQKMEQVLKRMENACKAEDLNGFILMDVRFHLLVAESSKNRILAKILEIIRELFRKLIQKVLESGPLSVVENMWLTITPHRNIYEAILLGDPVEARKQAEIHIWDIKSKILKNQDWI